MGQNRRGSDETKRSADSGEEPVCGLPTRPLFAAQACCGRHGFKTFVQAVETSSEIFSRSLPGAGRPHLPAVAPTTEHCRGDLGELAAEGDYGAIHEEKGHVQERQQGSHCHRNITRSRGSDGKPTGNRREKDPLREARRCRYCRQWPAADHCSCDLRLTVAGKCYRRLTTLNRI